MSQLPPGFVLDDGQDDLGLPPGFVLDGGAAPSQGFIANELDKAMNAPADIGRMVLKGAAMGKEATLEDAADRANAQMAIGRKWSRGRSPQQPAATPEDYRPMFDAERQAVSEAEARSGWAGTAAQVVGALAPATAASKIAQGGAAAVSAVPGIGRVAANPYTQAAATGAGLGLMNAAGTDNDRGVEALVGAGTGIVGQGLASALAGGISKAAGLANPRVNIPTVDGIRKAKQEAYKAADDAGIILRPDLIKRIQEQARDDIGQMGYSPRLQPNIKGVLDELDDAAKSNHRLKDVDVIRRIAQGAYKPGDKANNAMMTQIINAIDDGLNTVKPSEIVMGNAKRGVQALNEARKAAATEAKINTITSQLSKAENQASRTYSGTNLDNAIRQKISSLLDNPARTRGFTKDELAALQEIVDGTATQNTLRWAGKFLPSSGVGGLANLGVSMTALGPAGLAIPAAGYGMKAAADQMSRGNVRKLVEVIAAGGSKEATRAPLNKVQQITKQQRDSLARALTGALVFNGAAASGR